MYNSKFNLKNALRCELASYTFDGSSENIHRTEPLAAEAVPVRDKQYSIKSAQ